MDQKNTDQQLFRSADDLVCKYCGDVPVYIRYQVGDGEDALSIERMVGFATDIARS